MFRSISGLHLQFACEKWEHLLVVHLDYLHVQGVDGGEDIGGALHHDLPVLGHGQRRAPRHKHGLVSGAERKVAVKMSLHKNHFLVTKPHLAASVP